MQTRTIRDSSQSAFTIEQFTEGFFGILKRDGTKQLVVFPVQFHRQFGQTIGRFSSYPEFLRVWEDFQKSVSDHLGINSWITKMLDWAKENGLIAFPDATTIDIIMDDDLITQTLRTIPNPARLFDFSKMFLRDLQQFS